MKRPKYQSGKLIVFCSILAILTTHAQSSQAPESYPAAYAESDAALVDAMSDHLDQLLTAPTENLPQMASDYLEALYIDWNHPGANFDYQEELIEALHWLAVHAGSEDIQQFWVAEAICDGLLAFYQSLPDVSPSSDHQDITAVYHIELGAAMKAAALAAEPGTDRLPRSVHQALVQIASNHAAFHPLYATPEFDAFLANPDDDDIYSYYVTALSNEWNGSPNPPTPCPCGTVLQYDEQNQPQRTAMLEIGGENPVEINFWDADAGNDIIVVGVWAYRTCVRLCQRACNSIADPTQRAACRVGCRAACLPTLTPKLP